MDLFEKFSDYIKDKIKASPEWESWSGVAPSANLNQEAAPSNKDPMDNFEDDIPF
jgi:hypothetical protein